MLRYFCKIIFFYVANRLLEFCVKSTVQYSFSVYNNFKLICCSFFTSFHATSPHKVFIDLWEWAFSVNKLSSLWRVQFRKCCLSRLPKLIHPLKHANPFAMWATYGELCLDFELVTGNWEVRNERLATFESFPLSDFRKLTKLADSGFHYTGYRDRVKCHG